MKTTAKTYQVEEIGTSFFVVYEFADGEKMLMSKGYSKEANAIKRMEKVKFQAGVK